jgi:hypothetical protein
MSAFKSKNVLNVLSSLSLLETELKKLEPEDLSEENFRMINNHVERLFAENILVLREKLLSVCRKDTVQMKAVSDTFTEDDILEEFI